MADLSYTVDVNTTPAQRNIDNLNKKIGGLTSTFDKLKGALAGLAVGAMVGKALQFADAIQDISDATGVATSTILDFNQALMNNGGDSDKAQQGLLKFVQTIGDAVDGSNSAQKALTDVGVSLKDIQTLSEEDLLKKAVDGVGKMENAAQRLAAQTALFGKSARGVNFQGVSQQFGKTDMSANASAIKAAADAQQALENNLKNLTQALINVMEPLNNIAGSVKITTTAFESLLKALAYAVTAYLALTKGLGLVKTIMDGLDKSLKASGGLFAWLGKQIAFALSGLASFGKGIARATGIMTGATSAAFSFAAAIAGLLRFFLRFLGVVGIIMSVAEAINFLSKQFLNFDILDWVSKKWDVVIGKFKEWLQLKNSDDGSYDRKEIKNMEERAKAQAELNAKAEAFKKRQAEMTDEISKFGNEYKKVNTDILQRLGLEKELVGKSEDEKEVVLALEDSYDRQKAAIDQLIEKRKDWAKGTEEQKASLGIIDAEITKIKQLGMVQDEQIVKYIGQLQGARLLEQDRVNTLQRITDQLEKQKALDESILQIRQSTQSQLDTAGFEKSQMGRSPLEKQFAQIQEEARKAALEAGRAFAAQFNAEDMGAEDAKKLADGLALIAQRYKEIADAQSANIAQSRTFSQGWKDAFDQYIDNASNAANRANEVFSSITSNMNSAIDNFVENGKFSFKDLASSIIKDLLKIELKAQASMIMKSMGGLGGIFGGIGSLFGFAEGGQPPINKPSIVGEKGPELFVPKTAGTVIPNDKMGMGGTTNVTNITNNVSAIDAKSVAQFFAENRRTLLGTVQLAQKEMPYGNR